MKTLWTSIVIMATAAASTITGCADEKEMRPQEDGVLLKTSPLLGSTTYDASCHPADVPHLGIAFAHGRIASRSPAFQECINTAFWGYTTAAPPGQATKANIGPYIPCSTDPPTPQPSVVLDVLKTANPTRIVCDYSAIGTSSGGNAGIGGVSTSDSWTAETVSVGSVLGYFKDVTTACFDNPGGAPCAGDDAYAETGATIIHEILHQHGYNHFEFGNPPFLCGIPASQNPSYANSINYQVGECLRVVLEDSAANCQMHDAACGPDGLSLQTSIFLATPTCACVQDPKAPVVSSLFPSTGGPAGGTSVRIDGSGFDTTGGTVVFFGAWKAAAVNCPSSTQCFATSASGSGIVDVTVIVNRFTSGTSNNSKFYYLPSVTGLSATSGNVGDIVTIHGLGFSAAPGATSISFGPYPVTNAVCYPGPDCTAIVPPGGGVVDVLVTVNGTTSGSVPVDRFAYKAVTVTSVARSVRSNGQGPESAHGPVSGGTYLDIRGAGFDPNAPTGNNMQVLFGGTPSDYVVCSSSTSCEVRSPAVASAGPVHITVTVFGGTSIPSMWDLFTYDLHPALTGIWDTVFDGAWVQLDGFAPAGGTVISLTTSDPSSVTLPASVTVLPGAASATFPVTVLPVAAGAGAVITASYEAVSFSTPAVQQYVPRQPTCKPLRACAKGFYWNQDDCACESGLVR